MTTGSVLTLPLAQAFGRSMIPIGISGLAGTANPATSHFV